MGNQLPVVCERLKALRRENNYTQKYVAVEIGVETKTYRSWEIGYYKGNILTFPRIDHINLEKLSDLYKVSTDYILGRDDLRKIDNKFIHDKIGISENAINTLKKIYAGNESNDFFDTLNFLIGKDFRLFIRFIDAIELYFDESFDTSMTFEENRAVPINNGNSSILYKEENDILIGSYDQKLCNGNGGYRIRGIPISIIKKGYSMQAIQLILEELKREKRESD